MKTRTKAADAAKIERKKIEEKGAVGFRGERNHFPFLIRTRVVIDPLQIGGFPAKAGSIVHKLAVNFSSGKINERHNSLRIGSHLLIAQALRLSNARER